MYYFVWRDNNNVLVTNSKYVAEAYPYLAGDTLEVRVLGGYAIRAGMSETMRLHLLEEIVFDEDRIKNPITLRDSWDY